MRFITFEEIDTSGDGDAVWPSKFVAVRASSIVSVSDFQQSADDPLDVIEIRLDTGLVVRHVAGRLGMKSLECVLSQLDEY